MDSNEKRVVRPQDNPSLPAYYSHPLEQLPFYLNRPVEQHRVSLMEYWRIVVKRRWVIISIVSAALVVTAIATWKSTPAYRATVKLQIDPEQQNILPFKEALDPGSSYAQSKEYLQTQFEVLESRSLAERVIKALNLDNNPIFAGETKPDEHNKLVQWFRGRLGVHEKHASVEDAASLEERRIAALVDKFIASLTTAPIRDSRLVDVSFDSVAPKLAAAVANTLATQYIRMNFETKYNATNAASDFLAAKLIDLKARVEKSEENLVAFSRRHDIYTIADKENVILQKLADLNAALTAAQSERIQKESVWRVVQQSPPGSFPEILRNDLVKNLEANATTLRLQKARLDAQFKQGWPELDQVTEQLAEAEKQLQQERQRAIGDVQTEYRTALQKEKLLSEAVEAQKSQVDDLNQNSIQYNILQRQVETEKQLYEGLLQRMKEAGVSAGLQSNNIHVVDHAQVPQVPFTPNKPRNLALGLVVGLVLGTGLAFFIEHLDNSIKTPDDIDRHIDLPSLGVIPALGSVGTAKGLKIKLLGDADRNGGNGSRDELPAGVEMITYHNTKSLISEAYRSLRTSVLLSSGAGRPPKVLLMTSSQSEEGKTTSALNLAVTLAQMGGRVVVLDCDMRKPRIHRILGLNNQEGMSTYLSGNSDLSGLIQKSEVPDLFAVTAGPIPPNPAELVGSMRMKHGIESLAGEFEYIIIDSPPVLAVSDARILASIVDGVILVIKGGETPKEAVLHAKRLLEDVHGHLIGTLLNNVDVRSADYHYYSRYYHYGYGKYGYGHVYGENKENQSDD